MSSQPKGRRTDKPASSPTPKPPTAAEAAAATSSSPSAKRKQIEDALMSEHQQQKKRMTLAEAEASEKSKNLFPKIGKRPNVLYRKQYQESHSKKRCHWCSRRNFRTRGEGEGWRGLYYLDERTPCKVCMLLESLLGPLWNQCFVFRIRKFDPNTGLPMSDHTGTTMHLSTGYRPLTICSARDLGIKIRDDGGYDNHRGDIIVVRQPSEHVSQYY